MRGDQSVIAGVPQAVAVLDLALAGVSVELMEDPFDWLGGGKKAAPVPAPVSVDNAPRAGVEVLDAAEVARPVYDIMAPQPPPKRVVPQVAEIPASVWREGENADVVLVVQGGMPDERCQQLARAMLAAIGLKDVTLGWAGYVGKPAADVLRTEVVALGGTQVLVMGQGPLGILLGRNLGVEGWHAAGGAETLGLEKAVGVTYPLELLLKQPLFKRLAWQHLLAWGNQKILNKGV